MRKKQEDISNLPQHIQDAFNNGGSVTVQGKSCLTPEDYELAMAEVAEKEAEAAPVAVSGDKADHAKVAKELKEANKALETSKADHAKVAKELETVTNDKEVYVLAVESAKTLIKHFVPQDVKGIAELPPGAIADLARLYEIQTAGVSPKAVNEAILAAVHTKE